MNETIKEKVMFCCSTHNQTVNVIPAIQLGVSKLVLFSTAIADKRNWTKRLLQFCVNHDIQCSLIEVDDESERHPEKLATLIEKHLNEYKDSSCFINIGGGQKPFTIAFYKVFSNSMIEGIELVYTEGNQRKLMRFGKDMLLHEVPLDIRIGLDALINLYGYHLTESVYAIETQDYQSVEMKQATNAARLLKGDVWFQKIFYGMCDNPHFDDRKLNIKQAIQKTIESLAEEDWAAVIPSQVEYQNLENEIIELLNYYRNKKDIPVKKLEKISGSSQLFKEYWNGVKRKMAELVYQNLHQTDENNWVVYDCRKRNEERVRIQEAIESIGGLVTIASDGKIMRNSLKFPRKIGDFFEAMVLSEVLVWLETSKIAKQNITHIFANVKTAPENKITSEQDAEYDIVLMTRYGTLILIEVKSAKLERDTIRTREFGAFQKSGPYGKSIIVGPLVKSVLDESGRFKDFVPPSVVEQYESARFLGSSYAFFDELGEKLDQMIQQE